MKLQDFKIELRQGVEKLCNENDWNVNDNKQRGMAFEDWCFNLLAEKYPTADNDKSESIFRTDDFEIDVTFSSGDTREIYFLQCKYPYLAQSRPIVEGEVKSFFSTFDLLRDSDYLKQRGKGFKIRELSNTLDYSLKQDWTVHFVFVTTDIIDQKIEALAAKFNSSYAESAANINFSVWDINVLKEVYLETSSPEEAHPEMVSFTLADDHFMQPDGKLENITFAVRGTELQAVAKRFKEALFNWNIRQYLGRKGEVNKGVLKTIEDEPENFYYYNNGISALCEDFEFSEKSKNLVARKLQIVNGAQTIGAIRVSHPDKLKLVLVLVKLTRVKHFSRETGIAAELIRSNNTQNKLAIPDFRSNDKIQIWLEKNFKDTKSRGSLLQIDYGRKKPYPRSSINKQVIKLQELGKIRFAWLHDPRIPIADPASLFVLPIDNGLYGSSFGIDGALCDVWTEEQFRDTLLALHTSNKIIEALNQLQEEEPKYKQIIRLKYYALNLFKKYLDNSLSEDAELKIDELYQFGKKYDAFFDDAMVMIITALTEAYDEMIGQKGGTLFALPRDMSVWSLVQAKFENSLKLAKRLQARAERATRR